MREKMVKRLSLLALTGVLSLSSQTVTPASMDVPKFSPSAKPIPKHLVYQRFLAMVNDLNNKALQSGDTDQYRFAQPFARAGFQNGDLDTLRTEAAALLIDLAAIDAQAAPIIASYREKAKAAAQLGQPVPPLPAALSQLQAIRTAVSVNHMMTLQSKLGKQKTSQLEAYLAREVTPRVSLKALANAPVLPSNATSSINDPPQLQ